MSDISKDLSGIVNNLLLALNPNSWDEFKAQLEQRNDDVKKILQHEFEREEEIMKFHENENDQNVLFATYTSKDTILNKALRMTPPKNVLDYFEKVLPAYKKSRALFDIAHKMELTDNRWKAFKDAYRNEVEEEDLEHILKIRHTKEELTILAIAVRKNPPLEVIKRLLEGYMGAISVPHIAEEDGWCAGWIPLHYALKYQASSKVAIALIPTENDVKNSYFLNQIDVLGLPDRHDRNLLHWAAYYNASLDTITALKKACPKDLLRAKDYREHVPYETAIWYGRPMEVVREFFVPGCDKGDERFEDAVARLTRSILDKDDGGTRYGFTNYDLPSIAQCCSETRAIQQLVAERSSNLLPVFLIMAEFLTCLLLIVSYHFYIERALPGEDFTDASEAWFIVLCVSISIMTLYELIEMLVNPGRWFTSIWNYCDVATIVLVIISAVKAHSGRAGDDFSSLVVVTTAFIWMDLILFLRSTFVPFAVFVSGIFKIFRDLISFVIVTFFILLAFADMFKLESIANDRCSLDTDIQENRYLKSGLGEDTNLNTTGTFCTIGDAFFTTYGLVIDGMDVTEYAESPLMKGISIMFTFLVSIILLNIVIAILSTSWEDVVKQSDILYWENRLEFLVTVRRIDEFLDKYLCSCSSHDKWRPLQNKLDAMDRKLSSICKLFWPSEKYFGRFDSIFERMCGNRPGSFRKQLIYEFEVKKERGSIKSKIFILLKAVILMIVFWTIALMWFTIGLITLGLLWPRAIRTFIFGYVPRSESETDKTEETSLEITDRKKIPTSEIMKRIKALNGELERRLTQQSENDDDLSYDDGSCNMSSTPTVQSEESTED